MPIPTHDEIKVPGLKLLKEKGVIRWLDFY